MEIFEGVIGGLVLLGLSLFIFNRFLGVPWRFFWAMLIPVAAFGLMVAWGASSGEHPPLVAPAILAVLFLAAAFVLALRLPKRFIWAAFLVSFVATAFCVMVGVWVLSGATHAADLVVRFGLFFIFMIMPLLFSLIPALLRFGRFATFPRWPVPPDDVKQVRRKWWYYAIVLPAIFVTVGFGISALAVLSWAHRSPLLGLTAALCSLGMLALGTILARRNRTWKGFPLLAAGCFILFISDLAIYIMRRIGISPDAPGAFLPWLLGGSGLLMAIYACSRMSIPRPKPVSQPPK